jgi:hypothetical protein
MLVGDQGNARQKNNPRAKALLPSHTTMSFGKSCTHCTAVSLIGASGFEFSWLCEPCGLVCSCTLCVAWQPRDTGLPAIPDSKSWKPPPIHPRFLTPQSTVFGARVRVSYRRGRGQTKNVRIARFDGAPRATLGSVATTIFTLACSSRPSTESPVVPCLVQCAPN